MGAREELSGQLGQAQVVARLSDDECSQLLDLVKAVRRSRLKAMFAAIDQALGHLPRLLRGPAKKILLG